jgi:nucleoid-associated protein YgaU
MQQIERYGVIALVFLLVTIVAVSFWGDSKSPGFWSRLTGKSDGKKEQSDKVAAADKLAEQHVVDGQLPLTPPTTTVPPVGGPTLIDGNTKAPSDHMPLPAGPGLVSSTNDAIVGTPPNPFAPGGVSPQPTQTLPQAQPPPPSATEYVVQKGDSLASIARKKLGAESRWTEIQAANKGLEPKNLKVGETIMLPAGGTTSGAAETTKVATITPKTHTAPAPETKKSQPAAIKTASTYKVKKGDGLRSIARTQLGDESRWKDILAANPGLKADRLQAGDMIKLPSTSHATVASASAGPALASASVSTSSDKPRVR